MPAEILDGKIYMDGNGNMPETAYPAGIVIEDMDPETEESFYYVFRDGQGEIFLGLSVILSGLRFAGKEKVLPIFEKKWWNVMEHLYPGLRVPYELWSEDEKGHGKEAPRSMAGRMTAGIPYFLLQDGNHQFTIKLTDALMCLKDAERRYAIPEAGRNWWNAVKHWYPGKPDGGENHEKIQSPEGTCGGLPDQQGKF